MDPLSSAKPTDREIFIAAARIADPDARHQFLIKACGDDSRRYCVISELLAKHAGGATSPIDMALRQIDPAAASTNATAPVPSVNHATRMIDRYKLLEPIGEGGFGTVYLAEQSQPVRRKVALKVIKPGMDSKEVIARFEAERQALAMMDHPNIARVVDAGTTPQGHPYFAMELVKGLPITEHCDAAHLSIPERLKLFVDICHAVQHAHQKGLIHRDLKPSNVMVTMHDDQPVVKVIDFGVAKALNHELTERTLFTRYGQMVGTPRYMSPEQAQLSGLDIDTRSDIYSLGVLLYELLTGTTPFDKETLQGSSFDEIRRILREVDPPPPSVRVNTLGAEAISTLSVRQSIDPRKLASVLSGELDWIVMRALEKNRNMRYQSASAFAEDVERYLADEPVQACPPSWTYRLGKLARRHKTAFTTATLMLLAILVGAGVATIQAIRATRAENLAQAESAASRRAAKREAAAREDAEQLTNQTRRLLAQSHLAAGVTRLEDNDLARSLPWFVAALEADEGNEEAEAMHRIRLGMVLQQCPKLVGLFESGSAYFDSNDRPVAIQVSGKRAQVYDLFADQPIGQPFVADVPLSHAGLSPDCRYAVGGNGTQESLWEIATGRVILKFTRSKVDNCFFSPTGEHLALISSEKPEGRIFETSTGQLIDSPQFDSRFYPSLPAFSADGKQLAWVLAEDRPEYICFWNTSTERIYRRLTGHQASVNNVSFDRSGTRLLTLSTDCTARVWDTKTLELIATLRHGDNVWNGVFSPDGSRVATFCANGTAQIWDAATGYPTTPPLKHDSEINSGTFSRDGRYCVTCGIDNTARVWDTTTGRLTSILTHSATVGMATFDSQARYLMTFTGDRLVNVWDLASSMPPGVLIDHGHGGFDVQFTDDSQALLGIGTAARLWDVRTGNALSKLIPSVENVQAAIISPNGDRIATRGRGRIEVFDRETLRPISKADPEQDIGNDRTSRGFAFGLDQRWVLGLFRPLAWATGFVRVFDTDTGNQLAWPVTNAQHVLSAAVSPDGQIIATGSADHAHRVLMGGSLQLWSGRDGTPLGEAIPHRYPVSDVFFSRDGQRVITLSVPQHLGVGTVHAFDVATRAEIGTPIDIRVEFKDGDINRNGSRVVIAGRDHTTRVWDVDTGKSVTPAMSHGEQLNLSRLSADGRLIATTTGSYIIPSQSPANLYLWNAATGQRLSPPLFHSDPTHNVRCATFSPDGKWVASVSADGTTRIWPIVSETRPIDELKRLAEILSSRKFDSLGALVAVSREEKLAAWRSLRAINPPAAQPQQLVAWHHAHAVQCMETKRWADAITHLNYVIAQVSDQQVNVRLRRARCNVELERWREAADDMQAALNTGWTSPSASHELAVLALKMEDIPLYQATCAAMLKAYTESDDAFALRSTAAAVAMASNVDHDYEVALRVARRAVELDPDGPFGRLHLGKLLYRTGKWEEAITMMPEPRTLGNDDVAAQYYLAMTYQRLGEVEKAREAFEQANRLAAVKSKDNGYMIYWALALEIERLRAEAEALIGED